MGIYCSCRNVNDRQLKDAFDKQRQGDPNADVSYKKTHAILGKPNCGICTRAWINAEQQYNKYQTIPSLPNHSSPKDTSETPPSGLCSVAIKHRGQWSSSDTRKSNTPPDLSSIPILPKDHPLNTPDAE